MLQGCLPCGAAACFVRSAGLRRPAAPTSPPPPTPPRLPAHPTHSLHPQPNPAQDFPYYLMPGIAHMNLWANRPLAPAEVEAAVAQRVRAGTASGRTCRVQHAEHATAAQHSTKAALWPARMLIFRQHAAMQHHGVWQTQSKRKGSSCCGSPVQAPPGCQATWFVNTPTLQSVPTIWHAHVLWRQPTADSSSAAKDDTAGGGSNR